MYRKKKRKMEQMTKRKFYGFNGHNIMLCNISNTQIIEEKMNENDGKK